MLKTVLFAAAAATSLGATPSIAAPISAAPAVIEGAAAVTQAAPAKTQRVRETRYCVVGMITGSYIRHKECHTRKEWIDLTGTDPLDKN